MGESNGGLCDRKISDLYAFPHIPEKSLEDKSEFRSEGGSESGSRGRSLDYGQQDLRLEEVNIVCAVYVEVLASSVLPDSVVIESQADGKEVFPIIYDWKPQSCSHCLTFGHDDALCSKRPRLIPSKSPVQDGFTTERRGILRDITIDEEANDSLSLVPQSLVQAGLEVVEGSNPLDDHQQCSNDPSEEELQIRSESKSEVCRDQLDTQSSEMFEDASDLVQASLPMSSNVEIVTQQAASSVDPLSGIAGSSVVVLGISSATSECGDQSKENPKLERMRNIKEEARKKTTPSPIPKEPQLGQGKGGSGCT
ncbi:hypothetical protein QJS10_CPB19g00447 [Acorus calamus]|uniref:Zinc knuckle CX2CX4HX4C domain-containing protein n=1 Tax=Acorus calamus TaxID=4465 RepID=A0AAV9CHQ5_ACOCL|nr:hypothetical protein QJS10_CPB19g00447 [Acorus calamus]